MQSGVDQLHVGPQEEKKQEVVVILLVPYTLGSALRNVIQRKERECVTLVGGGKTVKVVENHPRQERPLGC